MENNSLENLGGILKDVFKEPPPDQLLYHYTTQMGLKGIIEKRVLWCTHTQFLNDASEFKYAVNILRTLVKERISREQPASEAKVALEEIGKYANMKLGTMNVCVGSFSHDNGDTLSQWRAYGSENCGFSLGINGTKLGKLASEKGFYLARCIYDEKDQIKLLEALIDEAIRKDKARKTRSSLPYL